jgi:tyrosine-protein kinase Etk/Wzc
MTGPVLVRLSSKCIHDRPDRTPDPHEPSYADDEIDLLELWNILWEGKILILLLGFIGTVLATGYALMQERQYTATATFFSVSAAGQSRLGNLAGLASLAGVSIPTSSGVEIDYMILLKSREFSASIIEQLNLIPILFEDQYDPVTGEPLELEEPAEPGWVAKVLAFPKEKLKTLLSSEESVNESQPVDESLEKQQLLVRAHTALTGLVSIDKAQNGLYSVSVTQKNPRIAAAIANTYIKELEAYLRRNNLTKSQQSRLFIEAQLQKTESKLEEYEEKLKRFSETYGIFSVSDQASAISESIGKIKAEISLEEVKLEVLQQFRGRDNQEVHLTRLKIDALQKRLEKLERGIEEQEQKAFAEIAMKDLPALGLQFGRLQRELEIQQQIYKMLRTQLESTRIEEARDSDIINVLDDAIPPENPSRPKRKMIVLVGGAASGMFSVFLVFFLRFIQNARKESRRRAEQSAV